MKIVGGEGDFADCEVGIDLGGHKFEEALGEEFGRRSIRFKVHSSLRWFGYTAIVTVSDGV